MRRNAPIAAIATLAVVLAAPARAQDDDPSFAIVPDDPAAASGVAAQAAQLVPYVERVTGMPILILERTGDDPGQFWYKAMQALCAKTGDNWCDEDVQFLTDTTNLLGWSRVLTYRPRDAAGNQGTVTKTICVILPPKPGVSAGFTGIGLAGGGVFTSEQLPSDSEAEAYLYLLHAASCGSRAGDQKRSDAFASLALTLLEGSPDFLSGRSVSPARKFSNYRSGEAIRWSVSVGERLLLDLWKGQASQALQAAGCAVNVVDSKEIDVQSTPRDAALPRYGNCAGASEWPRQGTITDGNLWLWGQAGISMPPQPYRPFASFGSIEEGVRYAWTTSGSVASQR